MRTKRTHDPATEAWNPPFAMTSRAGTLSALTMGIMVPISLHPAASSSFAEVTPRALPPPQGAFFRDAFIHDRLPESYVARLQRAFVWILPAYALLIGQRALETADEVVFVAWAYAAQAAIALTATAALLTAPRHADTTLRFTQAVLMLGYVVRLPATVAALPGSLVDLQISLTGFLGTLVLVQMVFAAQRVRTMGVLYCLVSSAVALAAVFWHVERGELPTGTVWFVARFVVSLGLAVVVMSFLSSMVTDRTRLEYEATRRAGQAGSRSKATFLARMSHELRTPLHGILGLSELLGRDREASARQREYATMITASAERLLGLLNGLLVMAELDDAEAGVTEARPQRPPPPLPNRSVPPSACLIEKSMKLPPKVVAAMQRHAAACDTQGLATVIDQIEAQHGELARAMRSMVRVYDYDALNELLQCADALDDTRRAAHEA